MKISKNKYIYTCSLFMQTYEKFNIKYLKNEFYFI